MRATLRLALSGVRARGAAQVAVLVAVTALASAAVVAGLAGQRSTATLVDEAFELAGRPHVVLYGPPDALAGAAGDPAVDAASAPAPRAPAETETGGETVGVAVTAVDPGALPEVGRPRLVDGRWPAADSEVVVERSIVVEGVVDVGGTMALTSEHGSFTVRVTGSAIELSDCFYVNEQCDPLRLFGTPGFVHQLAGGEPPVHTASYRLRDPARAAAFGAEFARGATLAEPRGQSTWDDTRGDILVIGEVFGAMVSGFGAFLLAAACFVVAGATAARLVARRRSLGLLRAVGFRPREVMAAVLLEHVVIGAAGVAAGWVLGSLASPQLHQVDRILDTSTGTFQAGPLVIALLLVELFLAAAVVVPAWRAGREPASVVLRDVPPMPTGGRWLAAAARRLGASPSLVAGLRRAVARPVRALLAGGAILVAATGAIVAAGFIGSVDAAVDDPARVGDPFDVRVFPGPAAGDLGATLDGVPEVASWHTERDVAATIGHASYRAHVVGGDVDGLGYLVQEGRPLQGPGEAIVGYAILDATGLEVGDRLPLEVGGTALDLEIVGWYLETSDAGKIVLLHESSLPSATFDEPLAYNVTATPGRDRDELAGTLREVLGDRAIVVAPDPGDAGLSAISATLAGFAALLAVVAAANLVATTMASTRERARALGVLRTIGCTTGQLVRQSAAGAALLGFVAAVVGVPLGLVVFRVLSDAVTSGVGIGPGLGVAPPAWFSLAVIPAATAAAALSGGVAALGLSRKPAAELVRFE